MKISKKFEYNFMRNDEESNKNSKIQISEVT